MSHIIETVPILGMESLFWAFLSHFVQLRSSPAAVICPKEAARRKRERSAQRALQTASNLAQAFKFNEGFQINDDLRTNVSESGRDL